ncbi:hypothetical protein IQ07DRAFT_600776 [Pyrenochaeta sp. DS3sAY3a]|nr:hypothetical protein IQ07DRAFT_600776 [Pyrenochaeta sp. DS3sAY3a]
MRSPSLRTAITGLAVLAGTASAVSLSSFTPRIDILPSACAAVYNAKIDGCVASDFNPGATCTSACVQGLVKIGEAVLRSCANVDVGETSIIGVFQNDLGIQALCPGVTVTTIPSSTSTTRAPSQTTTSPATTTSTSTENDDDEPSSTSSGGLIVDPSATGGTTANTQPTNAVQPVASSPASSPAAQSSPVGNSQLSNADSGGGSPFDITASGSSQLQAVGPALAALIATALLFVACA